eukprot:8040661-Ditylum_brightwellii.AAC.1
MENIVNAILLKEPGNNKIHKIRVIHIYEADYSAMTRIIWSGLIKSSEKHRSINKGQTGSRARHNANTLSSWRKLKTVSPGAVGNHW